MHNFLGVIGDGGISLIVTASFWVITRKGDEVFGEFWNSKGLPIFLAVFIFLGLVLLYFGILQVSYDDMGSGSQY